MSTLINPWEDPLLQLAEEATTANFNFSQTHEIEQNLLEQAYAYCDELTSIHSKSFYVSSSLLPYEKRRAVRALYAFCRVTDDIVDKPDEKPGQTNGYLVRQQLDRWQRRAFSTSPPAHDLVAVAWADARIRFQIPQRYGEQLIEGVACDLIKNRYQTFEELATYSYGVASTVGLMSMHITGFSGPEAISYAIKLGVALQITNILRDIGEDWRNGRVYLPQEELAYFGLDNNFIDHGQVDDRWRNFMRFQIERNRRLYSEAWAGIRLLDRDGRFAIAAAADLYKAILGDIERHDYDVFSRRAYVSKRGKLVRLPGIWWRSNGPISIQTPLSSQTVS